MTDSNPNTKGPSLTPNKQDKQTQQQNNTTNSYKKEYVNTDTLTTKLDALKIDLQNQKNGEEISGPALAGIIDTTVSEKEKVKKKVKKPEPKD